MLLVSNNQSDQIAQFEPKPVIVLNEMATSRLVFCCDHAGSEVPSHLGNLGVSNDDINDHIGLDIGIFATSCWIAGTLQAPLVAQPISRLVIDCNRTPESSDSIREAYDGREIIGNAEVDVEERNKRKAEILLPYQNAVSGMLEKAEEASECQPILIAMHSFTRTYGATRRNCDIGVIFDGPQEFATALLQNLKSSTDLHVMHNEPYHIDFDGDYTIPTHTVGGKLPYVEIEICQDLISTCRGQREIARLFSIALTKSLGEIDAK